MRTRWPLLLVGLIGAGPSTRPVPATDTTGAVADFRRHADTASPAAVAAIADRLLAVQADAAQPWSADWGELLDTLHGQGRLDRPRWERFERQIVTFTLRVRPRVRQSDPVPAELMMSPARRGLDRAESLPFRVTVTVGPTLADGTGRVDAPAAGKPLLDRWPWPEPYAAAFHIRLPPGPDGHVALGHRRVTLAVHRGVRRGYDDAIPFDLQDNLTLSAELTVVADETDTVTPADPAFVNQLKRQLWFGGNPGSELGHVYLLPRNDGPSAGSYRVAAFAKQGGHERPLGEFRSIRGGGWVEPHDVDLKGLRQTEMTPVVRCPADMARDTVDQTTFLPAAVELRGPISLYR